jgi:hypothetical protein
MHGLENYTRVRIGGHLHFTQEIKCFVAELT